MKGKNEPFDVGNDGNKKKRRITGRTTSTRKAAYCSTKQDVIGTSS